MEGVNARGKDIPTLPVEGREGGREGGREERVEEREGSRGGRGGGREPEGGQVRSCNACCSALNSPRREVWGHKPASGLLQEVGRKAEGRRRDSSWGRRCLGGTELGRVRSHCGPRLRLGIVEDVDATRRCG